MSEKENGTKSPDLPSGTPSNPSPLGQNGDGRTMEQVMAENREKSEKLAKVDKLDQKVSSLDEKMNKLLEKFEEREPEHEESEERLTSAEIKAREAARQEIWDNSVIQADQILEDEAVSRNMTKEEFAKSLKPYLVGIPLTTLPHLRNQQVIKKFKAAEAERNEIAKEREEIKKERESLKAQVTPDGRTSRGESHTTSWNNAKSQGDRDVVLNSIIRNY